ncbi:MAG: hypothetical protein K6F69_05650, partial [Treponema sp.]|nr:hypothetical protein [Treponema sp.]
MKKVFRTVVIYIIISMIACIITGFLRKTPILLSKDINLYKFYTGLYFFFLSIPALCISGFIVGWAIEFDEHSASCDYSFSREIFNCFKHVIKTALVLVFIITASTEIALPYFSAKKNQMEINYELFSEYMDYGKKYLEEANVELAYQYASRAVLIDKFSNEAADLKNKIEYAYENAEHLKNYALGLDGIIDDNFSNKGKTSYTVEELMAKSKEATEKEEWFDAHYYAELAANISASKDSSLKGIAVDTATEAWGELENPPYFEKDEEALVYSKKIEGYEALRRGNAIKAYYIFHTLFQRSRSLSNDPDIKQYLEASEKLLVKNYFFLDETDGIEHLEDARNVYFSIKQENGESSVYHIQGVASLKKRNQYVKYL